MTAFLETEDRNKRVEKGGREKGLGTAKSQKGLERLGVRDGIGHEHGLGGL
jgi:hypothetical protein